MKRFVERDEQGSIKGSYAQPQEGIAEEELDDDHPDLQAFEVATAPKPRTAVLTIEDLAEILKAKGTITDQDIADRLATREARKG